MIRATRIAFPLNRKFKTGPQLRMTALPGRSKRSQVRHPSGFTSLKRKRRRSRIHIFNAIRLPLGLSQAKAFERLLVSVLFSAKKELTPINPYGLESAKPDLQSELWIGVQPLWIGVREAGPPIRVQEARGDIPGPCLWVTVCSGMGEGAIRGGNWGGRRAVGGEMDTAVRCGGGSLAAKIIPWTA